VVVCCIELLSAGRDGIIRRWDVAASRQQQKQQQPQCTAKLEGHTDWVTDIAVAHDRVLISCSNDGSLKLWDLGCDLPEPAAPGNCAITTITTMSQH
jgi:WD40 repeat protein